MTEHKGAGVRNSARSSKVAAIRGTWADVRAARRCARCMRPAPAQDSPEFSDWEAIEDGQQVTCPDCVTAEERQAMDEDAMAMAEKVRENRLRRMAERQGLRLEKSRRRDPRAFDFGTYQLVDVATNTMRASVHQSGYGLTLDQIEDELTK